MKRPPVTPQFPEDAAPLPAPPWVNVLVLLVGGGLLGMIVPRRAWRWALILGLSIVVGDYAAPQLHLIAREPAPVNWGGLLALIPAFIGTYIGVGVRSALATPTADR